MHKAAVLMSTYNGAKYLRKQIESILDQREVDVKLFIRDDGSSDDTLSIIEEYQKNDERIILNKGSNVGVGNSFMQLVYDSGKEFDYYAFSDQDDVWMPVKLINAITKIGTEKAPVLYCSNQRLVDRDLRTMGMRYDTDPDLSYKQVMCQNKVTGCTMVWNTGLQLLLSDPQRRPTSDLLNQRIHDVWVAMVAAVVGRIIYDQDGFILYRQHEANVVGVRKTNIISQWIKKVNDPRQRNGRSSICKEVCEKYGDLIGDKETAESLRTYAYYSSDRKSKKKLLKDRSIIQHTSESGLGFRVKVLLNLF